MGIGVKNLEKRESEFTRKLLLICIAVLCVLFSVGVGIILMLSSASTEITAELILKVFGYLVLPILSVAYILVCYYKKLLGKK